MKRSERTRREFVALTAAGLGAGLAGTYALRAASSTRRQEGRPIGFALVGVGGLTRTQLLPALKETALCRPAGLVTSRPEEVLPLAAEYGIPSTSIYSYEDMPRMADNREIDAVHIATPNSLHLQNTVAAAEAGKHVLCEKPMATSVAECRQMIEACEAAGVKLAIGYRLQFEAHHVECMRLAREGVFGDLKVIEASFGFRLRDPDQWRLNRELAGGGALIDAGIYAIQACRYLSGEEPAEVLATSVSLDPTRFSEVEESITWQLRFPSGCLAICASSYNTRAMDHFKVYGEEGWFGLSPAFRYRGLRGSRMDGEPLRFKHVDHFARELDEFSLCILEDRTSPVDGLEGLKDLIVIEAIYESARSGRAVKIG